MPVRRTEAPPRASTTPAAAPHPPGAAGPGPAAAAPADAFELTTLRIHYAAPPGTRIAVRGSAPPLSWAASRPARRSGTDTWTVRLPVASTGGEPLAVKPVLVGGGGEVRWSRGADRVVAPGTTADLHPQFFAERGTVRTLFTDFYSHLLGDVRDIRVYLPPGYAENPAARYPVVYAHDGQNVLAEADEPRSWGAPATLDHALGSGAMGEAIVVGIDHRDRLYELTPTASSEHPGSGGGARYLRFVVEELMPQVEQALRVRTGPASTAMLGSSLGGLLALEAAVRYPAVFGAVAALSPSVWWDERVMVARVRAAAAAGTLAARLYLDSGDAGETEDGRHDTRALAEVIAESGRAPGPAFAYHLAHGAAHDEAAWGARLGAVLGFLVPPG